MSNIIHSLYPDANIAHESITFPQFVLKHFDEYGDKVALISPKTNQSYTFSDIRLLSRRLAIGFRRNGGMESGDVLTICMTNHMEMFPITLGAGLLGVIINTANPAYTVRELVNQLTDCRARFLLTTADLVEKIEAVKMQCKSIRTIITMDFRVDGCLYLPDLVAEDESDFVFPSINPSKDLAYLFNSSGTTGLPKAVMLTHRTLVVNLCQVTAKYLKYPSPEMYTPRSSDVVMSAFPLFHIGGFIISGIWMLINGATCVVFDRYDPDVYLRAFRTYKVTILIVPPPVLVHYTKSPNSSPHDFESLQYVLCAGAVVSKELTDAVMDKMKPEYVVQLYGMTELSPMSHMVPLSQLTWKKPGSCGVVIPNTLCKVTDVETGEAVGPHKHGEICVKGPQIMEGYLNKSDATRQTIDNNGWLHTGDVGYYDEDEFFYIVDRIKDLIKVKAFQVAPAELETILFTHPSVADAAVVGCPDLYAGELPRAYIVLKPGSQTSTENIKQFIATQVVSYKRLEGGVIFLDEIPKTPSGKILRRLLREQAREDTKAKL